jgi:hypothetical protein
MRTDVPHCRTPTSVLVIDELGDDVRAGMNAHQRTAGHCLVEHMTRRHPESFGTRDDTTALEGSIDEFLTHLVSLSSRGVRERSEGRYVDSALTGCAFEANTMIVAPWPSPIEVNRGGGGASIMSWELGSGGPAGCARRRRGTGTER